MGARKAEGFQDERDGQMKGWGKSEWGRAGLSEVSGALGFTPGAPSVFRISPGCNWLVTVHSSTDSHPRASEAVPEGASPATRQPELKTVPSMVHPRAGAQRWLLNEIALKEADGPGRPPTVLSPMSLLSGEGVNR